MTTKRGSGLLGAGDTLLGVVGAAAPLGAKAARLATAPARLGWRIASRPPLVPEAITPAGIAESLQARGAGVRAAAGRKADRALDAIVPAVTATTVDKLDLSGLVQQVVTPELVDTVIGQLDLAAIVDQVVTDELVDAVIARLDVPALVTSVLTPQTIDAALDAVHPVAIVDQRFDAATLDKILALVLPDVMTSVLARLDLTQIARENVDLLALTNEVVDGVDLAGITNEVIDEIDLPGIIRESTSGVAVEVVRGTRASAASADEAVARFFRRRNTP